MVKLTKRSVELACPSATDKIIFDDDLAGFGLRISPSGRKNFIVQYRAGGRTRRILEQLFSFRPLIEYTMSQRIKKWRDKREKTLYGETKPDAIFVGER